jgi:hypothetical protein
VTLDGSRGQIGYAFYRLADFAAEIDRRVREMEAQQDGNVRWSDRDPRGEDGKPVPDFKGACDEFVKAQRKFDRIDAHPDKYSDKWVRMEWWDALGRLSDAERRV